MIRRILSFPHELPLILKVFGMLTRMLTMNRFGMLTATLLLSTVAWAQDTPEADNSPFSSTTIDLGTVVSDLDRSVKWYTEAIGLKELKPFDVPGEFGKKIGLSNNIPLHVRVLTLGEGETATKLKLMQFKTAPGARVDQTFLHSTYGFRYLTLFVKDIDASLERAAKHGSKPIADGVQPLPEGFPAGIFIAVLRDPDGNFVELVGPKGTSDK